jgi:acetyl-CoA acetyltransferase
MTTNQSARHHRDACAITGVGTTDYSRASGRSTLTLATQAAALAIDDAGLTPGQIDGIIKCDMDEVGHSDLAGALGINNLSYWGLGTFAGTSPCSMIGQAIGAILSGQATNVLVFRSLNGRSGQRLGEYWSAAPEIGGNGSYLELLTPYGLEAPGMAYGLLARRHMIEYGTRDVDLGAIALACHARANANPAAQRYGRPLTMDGYLGSRMIADPLRLFDYCLETDGAAAVVVSPADAAGDSPKPMVLIRAVAQGEVDSPRQGGFWGPLLRGPFTTAAATTAHRLYSRAGMGPADVDVAQFYDCFTITVLLQLEDYGFCSKGDGGPFASSGALELTGELPINTSGGHLADGYIHGMSHIVEGVRQLRGESTSPVPRAQTCLVTSGMPGPGTSAMILRTG